MPQLKLAIVEYLGANLYSGEECAVLLLAARIDARHRVVEAAETEFKQLVAVVYVVVVLLTIRI